MFKANEAKLFFFLNLCLWNQTDNMYFGMGAKLECPFNEDVYREK